MGRRSGVFAAGVEEETFWQQLSQCFGDDWQSEGEDTKKYLGEIADVVGELYLLDKPLNVGGGGIAIRVVDVRLSESSTPQYAVLKLPRPARSQSAQLNEILLRETERLRGLRHQNLIRILTHGTTPNGTHFYVMEYLDRPVDADQYLLEHPTLENLIAVVRSACEGLAYMHDSGTVHLDIKPANIFVSANGSSTVIADLGFAKKIDELGQTKYIGGTAGYKHPDHNTLIYEASQSKIDDSNPNRQMRISEAPRERISPKWDIYSLGVTLLVLLRVLELKNVTITSHYGYRYLKLMAHRMIAPHIASAATSTTEIRGYGKSDSVGLPLVEERYLGLQRDAMDAIAYASMDEVLQDVNKLVGTADLLREVPELSGQLRDVIQAASHGPVPFSDRVRKVVDSREVRALGRLDQLGLVRLVYPSASHSRLEHTLGTMSMATRFVRSLLSDPVSPLFKQLVRESDISILLALCLVHDIGHYPLAHDLEEVDSSVFSHELRTVHLMTSRASEVAAVLRSEPAWKIDVERLINILKEDRRYELPLVDMILRSIIDGPIDADKLDYLLRDSENLRLPYGRGVDIEKLMQCLTVVVSQDAGEQSQARIGIHDKGRIPAESVAFARYALYGSVYWHRTHRTLKAMLNRLALEVMKKSKSNSALRTELYRFLDHEVGRQLTLPDSDDDGPRRSSPYIDTPTQRMVWWLVEQIGDSKFDELAEDILFRRLYKRVLVVTRSRGRAVQRDWMLAEKVFGKVGQNWEDRYKVTNLLQEKIVRKVGEWDGTLRPGWSQFGMSESEVFVAEAKDRPIVLIDYPPVKSGSVSQLDYLRENEWSEDGRADLRVDHLEESSMWTSLVQEYSAGLGKMRVYVHPKYAGLVRAIISREDMEALLWASIKAVNK